MTTEEIKSTLKQLKSELERKEPIDAEARELLSGLESNIHAFLEETKTEPNPEASVGDLPNGVERLAIQLEADHPTLAPVLRQIGEALSRMGI